MKSNSIRISKIKTKAKKLSNRHKLTIFVLIFGVIGLAALLIVRAATPTAQFEAEDSSLTGNASTLSDTSASGGSALLFSAPPTSSSKLSWAPPSGWQNYTVRNHNSTGYASFDGGGGDMLITLTTNSAVGPFTIKNCRNAVVMGGQINVLPSSSANGADQRGIYVTGCSGTVHIEGVYINGDVNGSEADGVATNSPNAIVQIENVRIMKLRGTQAGNHADIVQTWGGAKELRIDRLTGSSNYQGYMIKYDSNSLPLVDIRNSNIEMLPNSTGGHGIWPKCSNGTIYKLTSFYIYPENGDQLSSSNVWNGTCPATFSNNIATYTHPDFTGSGPVIGGRPTSGDFVPAGSVGIGYTSPGYQ